MADDWGSFTQDKLREQAVGNVAGSPNVAPEAAVQAIRAAPVSGVPAAVAMHSPAEPEGMALFHDHTAILNTSPPVASFAASDPAKAAATKDDFGPLAAVGEKSHGLAATLAFDFFHPGVASARQILVDIKRHAEAATSEKPSLLNLIPGFSAQDKTLGNILADVAGTVFGPVSGTVNVAARPLSYVPQYTVNKQSGQLERVPQPEAQQRVANVLGQALLVSGFLPRVGAAPAIDLGTAKTVGEAPRLTGPPEPVVEGEFTDLTPPGVNPAHSEVYSSVAQLDAENVARTQGAIADTKTLGRSPALVQDFLENHTAAGGQEVSIPAETIGQLWSEGHSVFSDRLNEVTAGLVTGGNVKVPLSEYLAATAGQPFAEVLNAASNFREGGVSVDQAKELPKAKETTQAVDASGQAHQIKGESLPSRGLAPANLMQDGNIYVGAPNTVHFQIMEAFPLQEGNDLVSTGFVTPDGLYLTRKEAAAWVKAHEGEIKPSENMGEELDALDYREQIPLEQRQTSSSIASIEPQIPEDIEPEFHLAVREVAARADVAVEQVFKENALNTLFTEPKAASMSKGLFERYGEAVTAARAEIHDKLLQRTYNQIRKERSPDFKAAVQLHKEEGVKLIEKQPNVQAMRALADSAMKIDRGAIPAELRIPNSILKNGGLSPDEAAELADYPTGRDLLLDLHNLQVAIEANGGTLGSYIKARSQVYAEQQAREMTGYDVSPKALMEAAREAAVSPSIESLLIDALREVGERLGIPLNKNSVEAAAVANFNVLKVKDAARPKTFSTDMKRLGDKAEKALLDGKDIEAFKYKQQQLIQFHQLKMAYAFQRELARATKQMNQIAKKPIVVGMDQTARNQLRWIVREVGFKVNTGKYEGVDEALKGQSLEQYVNSLQSRGFDPVFATIPKIDLPDVTVDQFHGVADTVKSIAQLGRWEKKAFREGQAIELAAIAKQVKENANSIGRPFTAGELRQTKDKLTSILPKVGRAVGAAVARPETFLFWLDKETNGPLMQYLVSELQDGKYFKTDKINEIGAAFRDFVSKQPKGWQHSLEESVDVPELLYSRGADGQPIQWLQKRGDVVMMATHFGTESNFQKLIEGFGWDADTVRGVANRVLTEADWKYVQHILDINKALLPEVKTLYRATVGLAMKELPATPIPTPFGELPGGYRHISYDWNAIEEREGPDGEMMEQQDPTALHASDLFGPEYRVATPPNSYTLARTNFSAPLNLEHSILHREIESVIHDLAFRKALIQATKIMRLPQVRQGVREALGPEYGESISNWLKDIARGSSYDQTVLKGGAALVRGLRRRFTIVQIGYNVATLLKHGGIAASHIGGEVGIPEFAKASADLMKSQELQKWVDETSGEVRGSLMNLDRDVRELMQDLFRKQGFIENWRYHAFTMFGAVKRVEAMATWLAKYRTLTDGGMSHVDAVALANKSVRDTQGAGSPVDLPSLWRGDNSFWAEVGKLSNIFTGFENTATNRAWTIIRRSNRGGGGSSLPPSSGGVSGWEDRGSAGGRRDFGKSFSDLLSYFVIPALYATAFDLVSKGELHKHAKGGAVFLEHYLENTLKGMLGGSVPMGNMLAELPRAIASRGKDFGSDSPIKEMFGASVGSAVNLWDATHAKTRHKVEDRWVQHAFETAGYIFNLPVKPFSKGGQFLWDKSQGHVKDKSMVEFMRGLVFGPSTEEAKKRR